MRRRCRRGSAAFTLVEMLIVVSLVAVVLVLAAPSFRDFILLQRLKSINAQVMTDLQYARSEAVSRGAHVQAKFQQWTAASQMSCYVFYTYTDPDPNLGIDKCDCAQPAASRCEAGATEIRTVQVQEALSVFVRPKAGQSSSFTFDLRTGSIVPPVLNSSVVLPESFDVEAYIDTPRLLRTVVAWSGRVSGCIPTTSGMPGVPC